MRKLAKRNESAAQEGSGRSGEQVVGNAQKRFRRAEELPNTAEQMSDQAEILQVLDESVREKGPRCDQNEPEG